MSNIILVKWTPFREAMKLHSLQQGTLSLGNSRLNNANLLALAIAEATTPTTGWAKWRVGNVSRTSGDALLIQVRLVPGYVAPVGSGYANVAAAANLPVTSSLTGALSTGTSIIGKGAGVTWSGYAIAALTGGAGAVGSLAGTTNIKGESIAAILNDYSDGTVYVVIAGTLLQTDFTGVAFTDYTAGSPHAETYLTANAFAFSTVSLPGYTLWGWNATQGLGSTFATGHNPFVINFT